MKKIFICLVLLLLIVGCNKAEKKEQTQKTNQESQKETKTETKEEQYQDNNNTPIGLYFHNGYQLDLITEYKTNNIKYDTDIAIFQIYPSQESQISLTKGFGESFFEKWSSIPNFKNLKIGFNLKYTLDDIENGEKISHTILDPSSAIKPEYDYILTFLYDDYLNRNNAHYSHIEQSEYNDESLFTSIKLYCSFPERIVSKIKLTVFTYDDPDDIDENLEYRGNSRYTIEICDTNKTCN